MTDDRPARDGWPLERLDDLPTEPGVYVMKDRAGAVLYVGKAKNLRARVRQYFQLGSGDRRAFIPHLDRELGDLETFLVRSEKEALLVERELIKRHEPRYNVLWRDDKEYLCLRVDPAHEYPRVEVVRHMAKDGARYFGPFHSASAARQTLRVVNRYFRLRTCRDSTLYSRKRPCLEYQIGRCPGPCAFEIDREAYRESVRDVLLFLHGREDDLLPGLEARMWEASEREQFEVAARLRDQIRAIKKTLEPQHVASSSLRDQDVVGLASDGEERCFARLTIRGGRLRNLETHFARVTGFDDADALESFLLHAFSTSVEASEVELPREVLVPLELPYADALAELLSEQAGRRVRILKPERGEGRRSLELAEENARHALAARNQRAEQREEVLDRLARRLGLRRRPDPMECVDISNLQGRAIVASLVRFRAGRPDKAGYRRYRVRTTAGQDDFGAIYEVVRRRLERGLAEGDLPALLVIDGGKGQLEAARAALRDVGGDPAIELVSLAKSRVVGRGDEDQSISSAERVFVPGRKDPIELGARSAELSVLAALRDEAHRFAITYHRKLRGRAALGSELDGIAGLGPKKRQRLLVAFGSVAGIRRASAAEVAEVVGPDLAARVRSRLGAEDSDSPSD